MNARAERWLLAVVPFAAMLAVALGLRWGAPNTVRAALVYAAPPAGTDLGLAWQIVALEDNGAGRTPLAAQDIHVTAARNAATSEWEGSTNDDGVAEAHIALKGANEPPVSLEVRAGREVLARGTVAMLHPARLPTGASVWMPFAARKGPLILDVALLGERAAPGFAASMWVRVMDPNEPAGRERVSDATLSAEGDSSVASAIVRGKTNADGWAEVDVTPVGLAVTLRLHALAADGRGGEWSGGIFMSPGAAHLETRERWAPGESADLVVTLPVRSESTYVEVDNAAGRAWATALAVGAEGSDATPSARIHLPKLAAGLYWAVASNDSTGASELGSGTIVRPFFVAPSDDAALAYGADPVECAALMRGQAATRLPECLAMTVAAKVPRWVGLDGFAQARTRDAQRRGRGLTVALLAIGVAMLLEGALVIRAVMASRGNLRREGINRGGEGGAWGAPGLVIGLLVALLGFTLLAAFLVRAG